MPSLSPSSGQASAARYWYSRKRRDRPEKLVAEPCTVRTWWIVIEPALPRNPDHRHHVGLQVALLGNPFPVQQHLQGGTQGGEAKTLVFHFNDDRVVVGISNVGQVIQITVRNRAGAKNRLA